jgi:hypothetical protein
MRKRADPRIPDLDQVRVILQLEQIAVCLLAQERADRPPGSGEDLVEIELNSLIRWIDTEIEGQQTHDAGAAAADSRHRPDNLASSGYCALRSYDVARPGGHPHPTRKVLPDEDCRVCPDKEVQDDLQKEFPVRKRFLPLPPRGG